LTARSAPVTFADRSPASLPLPAGDVAQLRAGLVDESTWSSAWEVLAPTNRVLSVLMHLYAGEPTPTVADGLGYSVIQWQPGDIFIQYHDFPGLAGEYLETGLYDLGSLERLPLSAGNRTDTSARVIPPEGP
jgi:hypothetical protein